MFSYWEKDLFKPNYDFIVVGSGFAGLWLAYFLKKKKPGAQIAILERGTLPQGASTKNAGFSCFGSPSELLANVDKIGWQTTLDLTENRFQGIQIIKTFFGNTIDYNPCGASELFFDEEKFEAAHSKMEELNQNIAENVKSYYHFYLDKNIIQNSGFAGFKYAISNNQEASIHPGKLFYSLYKTLISMDVKIFFGTKVTGYNTEGEKVIVKTENLGDFTASHLSLNTNAFTGDLLPEYKIKPGRGQVLITKPIEGLTFDRTFHFDQGFYYFKNVGNKVLLGGGRNKDLQGESTLDFAVTENIINHLKDILKDNILHGKTFEIEDTWSGIMAFNESKTPISQILKPNLSANVCMNGMGVALAPTLSKKLAEELTSNG